MDPLKRPNLCTMQKYRFIQKIVYENVIFLCRVYNFVWVNQCCITMAMPQSSFLTHLYCLAVQTDFHRDAVVCLIHMHAALVQSPAGLMIIYLSKLFGWGLN